LAKGDSTQAAKWFEQAATVNAADALARLGEGTAAVMADEDDKARAFYRQALELDPRNKTAKRNLKILAEE